LPPFVEPGICPALIMHLEFIWMNFIVLPLRALLAAITVTSCFLVKDGTEFKEKAVQLIDSDFVLLP
jgi:hypothetical protein